MIGKVVVQLSVHKTWKTKLILFVAPLVIYLKIASIEKISSIVNDSLKVKIE